MTTELAEVVTYVITASAVAFILGWAIGFMSSWGRR